MSISCKHGGASWTVANELKHSFPNVLKLHATPVRKKSGKPFPWMNLGGNSNKSRPASFHCLDLLQHECKLLQVVFSGIGGCKGRCLLCAWPPFKKTQTFASVIAWLLGRSLSMHEKEEGSLFRQKIEVIVILKSSWALYVHYLTNTWPEIHLVSTALNGS